MILSNTCADTRRTRRMLNGHDIAAGVAANTMHAVPGGAYLYATNVGVSVPFLVQCGTLVVIGAQALYWTLKVGGIFKSWWQRRRRSP